VKNDRRTFVYSNLHKSVNMQYQVTSWKNVADLRRQHMQPV